MGWHSVGGLEPRATTTGSRPASAGDLGGAALALLEPRPGEHILQIGSGTGELALAIARAVGAGGRVVGVEPAAALAAEAARRAGDEGLAHVHFRAGALTSPGVADMPGAHAAVLVRALSRSRDPAVVLGAAVGAVGPGGRVVVAEADWEALELSHPDPALTRRVLSARRVGVRRPQLARELPGMAVRAGLLRVAVRRLVTLAVGRAEIDALVPVRAAALAPAEPDGVPSAAARLWWSTFLVADAEKPLVARLPGVAVRGAVPGAG